MIENYENVNFLKYELIGRKTHLSQELSRVIRLNAREIYNCDPSDMSISIKFNCDESVYLVMVYRNKGCMLKGYGYTTDEALRNCLTEFCAEVDKRVSSMRETINSLENSIKPFKMRRAQEILEIIEKLEENHRTEVASLKEELKNIRRRCKHPNKYVVAADKGFCDDCGDSVWLK